MTTHEKSSLKDVYTKTRETFLPRLMGLSDSDLNKETREATKSICSHVKSIVNSAEEDILSETSLLFSDSVKLSLVQEVLRVRKMADVKYVSDVKLNVPDSKAGKYFETYFEIGLPVIETDDIGVYTCSECGAVLDNEVVSETGRCNHCCVKLNVSELF